MMHISSKIRYNSKIEDKDLYFTIWETYYANGKKQSHLLLDIGFMEEKLSHYQIEAISVALNSRMEKYEGYSKPFKDESTLNPKVKEYVVKYWNLMVNSGVIASVHQKKEEDLKGLENCILAKTREMYSIGSIGVPWLLIQFLEKIEFRQFLRKHRVPERGTYAAMISLIAFAATPSNPQNDYEFEFKNFWGLQATMKLIEKLAINQGYKGKLPLYEEITSIPMRLLTVRNKLEKFFFSIIQRVNSPENFNFKSPVPPIVSFEEYRKDRYLNKTGRHRALNLEKEILDLPETLNHRKEEPYELDWYNSYLFLGWITYVVTTLIRNHLKKNGMTTSWNHIVEFCLYNQTLSLITGNNYKGEQINKYSCTNASIEGKKIYFIMGFEERPSFLY